MFEWPDFEQRLKSQLARKRPGFGAGKTLVYSMLTDGFSPRLVTQGVTERTLRLVVDQTAFRIRILTKNAIVGSVRWISLFSRHPERFVVGLSIGSADDRWSRQIESGTSSPSARLRALSSLQDAGVATFGMLCPVFPDVLVENGLERLIDRIRPDRVEHVWVEPYNDRANWRTVRAGYPVESFGHHWFTETYRKRKPNRWSRYASELYERIHAKARRDGWLDKLRFLLYEKAISAEDAPRFEGLEGVWLQSSPTANGRSRNRHIAALQEANQRRLD